MATWFEKLETETKQVKETRAFKLLVVRAARKDPAKRTPKENEALAIARKLAGA
jgi:hypothetical protein